MTQPITDQEISAFLDLPAHLRLMFQPFIDRIKEQDETIHRLRCMISASTEAQPLVQFANVIRTYDDKLGDLGIPPGGDSYNDLLSFIDRHLGIKVG